MRMHWTKTLATFGFGLITTVGVAQAQNPAPAATPRQVPAANANQPKGLDISRRPGDIPGPIDSLYDLQDSAKLAFMMADQNHDGLISQAEAIDAGNMLVGGIFFAADTNGDGTVTQDESQAGIDKVLQQNPVLRFVLQRAKAPNDPNQLGGAKAYQTVANLLDANSDKSLQASELRQAVASSVQGIFAMADTNRDNQLSPTELNAAVYGLARAGMQASFQQADADNNGSLSKDEFAKAIVEPAHTVFDILDANLDGQLSPDEIDRAGRVIASQVQMLRIPDAANSPRRLIESGQRPHEVAPIPAIPASPANPTAPAAPR